MGIRINKRTAHIAAEIDGLDLRVRPSPTDLAAVYDAWLDNIVIVFRGQKLDQADLLRATGYFGSTGGNARPREYRSAAQLEMLPGIMLISNVRANGEPIGALPDGEMMFHHDMLHAEIPDKGTFLYAVEVPSHGGNTLFASGYAAYETLDEELRCALEGRRAFHHYNYGSQHRGDNIGTPAFSESVHPVFRTHPETGRKAIYVDRLMTEYVLDMEKSQSDALLERVFDHSEKDAFVYEHVWRPGDLLLWDNRCSMHARRDFPSGERRLMWRTTLAGDDRPR